MRHIIIIGGLMFAVVMRVESQGLHITRDAHLVVTGAPQLVLQDAGLVNDGVIHADSSRCLFWGNSFIGGSRTSALYDLVISGDVQTDNHLSVAGGVFMEGGSLYLHGHTLDLGRTGRIVGERNTSFITDGSIKVSAFLDAPYEVNPGNIGIAFTSSANLGWTTIIRGHERQPDAVISRSFNIVAEKNIQMPVSYRLFYLDRELQGYGREGLSMLASSSSSGGWTSWGRDQMDPQAGWVVKRNIGGANFITLGLPAGRIHPIQVAPNPTAGAFTMVFENSKEEDRMIFLYDGSGHLAASRRVHLLAGHNSIDWSGAGLAAGVYRLQIEGMGVTTMEIMR